MHRYQFLLFGDGDYVVWEKLERSLTGLGWHWQEYCRWLVPGSYIDD